MKPCYRCGVEKPPEEMTKGRNVCKDCRAEQQRNYWHDWQARQRESRVIANQRLLYWAPPRLK